MTKRICTILISASAVAMVAAAAGASPAEAHSKASAQRSETSRSYGRRVERPVRQRAHRGRDSEMDIIRAESCDPGGRFAGYPAWARAAFSCGSQR